MSSEIAIKVDGLGKCYHIYDQPRDRLMQMIARRRRRYYREFWALKGAAFEVAKGEVVGIVGRNGSGKSTLLQLICGTLNPTEGAIRASGRIAALLELGSGFDPEFTGRENVYLNGAVLGFGAEEIDARYEDIVAFADIGDFIDQPIKTYSSGMVVRLAFAVAINVDPQILVVDEALSVGDELFQRKCFSRIEAIRDAGATILFVSHSVVTVVELCDRAILLDAGEQLLIGEPKHVVGQYQKLLYAPGDARESLRSSMRHAGREGIAGSLAADGRPSLAEARAENAGTSREYFDPALNPISTIAYESRGALIDDPEILDERGGRVNCLVRGRPYRYVYRVAFQQSASAVRFGMMVKTISGLEIGGGVSAALAATGLAYVSAGQSVQVEFQFVCNLNPGAYFLNAGVIGIIDSEETYLHRVMDLCMFRVQPVEGDRSTGIVDLGCTAKLTLTGT